MHQTTVRFTPDLWEAVEQECEALGISIAQYLREAAITRLAYSAGRREEPVYGGALEESLTAPQVAAARAAALSSTDSSDAVLAQSRLARERARELRSRAEATRGEHRKASAAARKLRDRGGVKSR
jgi:hypothetical protein